MAFKLIESAQTRWRAINAPHLVARPGGTMTTPIPAALFADPAPAQRPERAAAAPRSHGFTVEILDAAAAARARINDLIPEGASVFTGASETLRLSGIDEDINSSGRYDSVKARSMSLDRTTQLAEIWRLLAVPDVIVGSVAAVTETGSLVAAARPAGAPASTPARWDETPRRPAAAHRRPSRRCRAAAH